MAREIIEILVRRACSADHEPLLDCWIKSVQATHAFVSEADREAMIPQVRTYLSSDESELWVVCGENGRVMGFMGLKGSEMEALFLAPEFHRRGIGRRMVEFAKTLHADLTLDVNEENESARRFYEACGFVVEGRSEYDAQGRRYPLLHLRLAAR